MRLLIKILTQVFNMVVGTDKVQDRLVWYNNIIRSLRQEFYDLVDANRFNEATELGHRIRRLSERRAKLLAQLGL